MGFSWIFPIPETLRFFVVACCFLRSFRACMAFHTSGVLRGGGGLLGLSTGTYEVAEAFSLSTLLFGWSSPCFFKSVSELTGISLSLVSRKPLRLFGSSNLLKINLISFLFFQMPAHPHPVLSSILFSSWSGMLIGIWPACFAKPQQVEWVHSRPEGFVLTSALTAGLRLLLLWYVVYSCCCVVLAF